MHKDFISITSTVKSLYNKIFDLSFYMKHIMLEQFYIEIIGKSLVNIKF